MRVGKEGNMLNPIAFATSLAILAALSYLVFYVIGIVAPSVFNFLFNAQFFGANVSSLIPTERLLSNFIGTLVTF